MKRQGTVKMFSTDRHYGFIAGDDGSDHFFHGSQMDDGIPPEPGSRVAFAVRPNPRTGKSEACSIEVIAEPVMP